MNTIVRFAPSPTGYLHIGNIRVCLLNYIFAMQNQGKFILRIDDTDKERSKKELEDGIKKDLAWLCIKYDQTYNQSDRYEKYHAAIEILKQKGFLYPCYETPEELELQKKIQLSRKLPPVYERHSLNLASDEKQKYANNKVYWRFKLSHTDITWDDMVLGRTTINTKSISDPVFLKPDGNIVYTLASIVDDIDMKISHIIRGQDHVTNTAVQIELLRALSNHEIVFAHVPLLSSIDGGDISKRHSSDLSMVNLRNANQLPDAIINSLMSLGVSIPFNEYDNLNTICQKFDFTKISKSSPKFNVQEIYHLTKKMLGIASYEDYQHSLGKKITKEVWNILRENINTIADVKIWEAILFGGLEGNDCEKDDADCKIIINCDIVAKFLSAFLSELKKDVKEVVKDQIENNLKNNAGNIVKVENKLGNSIENGIGNKIEKNVDNNSNILIKDVVKIVKNQYGFSNKDVFHNVRLAITGLDNGPELQKIYEIIGMEEFCRRLKNAEVEVAESE